MQIKQLFVKREDACNCVSYLCAMRWLSIVISACILFFSNGLLFGQQESIYPPDGVYSSFTQFRSGSPHVTPAMMYQSGFAGGEKSVRQWVNSEGLAFVDLYGNKQSFNPVEFWGYVEEGTLHVFLGRKFHKVTLLGSISYFLESYPKITANHSPVVTEARTTSVYRLLDMETGDISEYTLKNLSELLERDEEIYKELMAISSSKTRTRKMFSFIEKYNKKHPLLAVTRNP